MINKKTQEISFDEYLKIKGLFHLATEHQRKCAEFEEAIKNMLTVGDQSDHISDELWGDFPCLDGALIRAGVKVIPNDAK